MPLFKLCDVSRTNRKAVVANSIEELITTGKKKLRLEKEDECFLFEEHDGTEIDDDESLLEYDKGTLFVLGSKWNANTESAALSSEAFSVTRGKTTSWKEAPQEHAAHFFPEVHLVDGAKTKELATSSQEDVKNEKVSKEEDFNFSITDTTAAACKSCEASSLVTSRKTPSSKEAPQEHAAHFFPEVHWVDGAKTKEIATSRQEDVKNEKVSKEEDFNFSITDTTAAACKSCEASSLVTSRKTPSSKEAPQEHATHVFPEVHVMNETNIKEHATSWQKDVENEKGSVEGHVNFSTAETIHQTKEKKTKSINDALMRTPCYHAKAKNMKIYSPEEIDSAIGMEKKRRKFWNEKAEQLSKNKKTRNQSKTVIGGLIDVSWTLRKNSMLEAEAKKLLEDEKVLFRKEDVTGRKLGNQKKDTILKNMDRMSAAHHAVEELDQGMTEIQESFNKNGNRKSFNSKNWR